MIKTDKETNVLLVEESSHPDMTDFIVKNIPERPQIYPVWD